MRVRALSLIALLSVSCATPAVAPPPSTSPASDAPAAIEPVFLRVDVEVPGMPVVMYVELHETETGGTGTIVVPMQGYEAELEGVVFEPELRFEMASLGAEVRAKRDESGVASECMFQQRGAQFACSMLPIEEEELRAAQNPPRPQTPTPPFPYASVDVAYDNEADGVHLEGTLTVPSGPGPHPAVVLVSGSGAQDRDSTVMRHKPFLLWADHLSRRGVAVLRVDDRGVGGSTGTLSEATGASLARDVVAGVEFLRADARIDPARVGILGHSEGASIAPRVASEDSKLAFIVLLAGPGVPGWQLLGTQVEDLARAAGTPEAQVEQAGKTQAFIMGKLREAESVDAGVAVLAPMVGEPQARATVTPWFLDFVQYDPQPTLRAVQVPVLALFADLDLQVSAKENAPAMRAALAENSDATVEVLSGLNHLLQPAKSGLPTEYVSIETTVAPAALERVSTWIAQHTQG